MKCKCGNDKFIGHQIIRADVIVNENGDFDENLECGLEKAIYDAERPYGPFSCTKCRAEYEEITR